VVLLAAAGAGGCSGPCCTYDSRPIPLARAPQGELLAAVEIGGQRGNAVVDTGTPVTVLRTPDAEPVRIQQHDLSVLAAGSDPAPTRATFRGVTMIEGPLQDLGNGAPLALLGGDLLTGFSVEIGFSLPEIVFWSRQPASDAFLSTAGYAVLRIKRRGASETVARAPPDSLGASGPYQFPPSLLELRACAAPAAFDRTTPPPSRCCAGDERTLSTGVDLALLLGTGYGPIILSRSAWDRIARTLPVVPPTTAGPLRAATADTPTIDALWSTLPRLALVDREADTGVNPGPCVELGRARRLEQIAVLQAQHPDAAPCALPCDQDPNNAQRAQNSAAYIELAGDLPVAIVPDGEPLLASRSAQVVPDGPQIDGILGAAALRSARVEIDYRGQPARAAFSCEVDASAELCRSVGRCPRLPSPGQTHTCFGLPAHGLPGICDNLPAACP
jgi:hypothetical protein